MDRDWNLLADAILAAREEKGLTRHELALLACVSPATVQGLESGRELARLPRAIEHIEEALGWQTGSAQIILVGGQPIPRG
ncbi:helix-turn-helix domain-containing protein [Streptantibioticus ferralitis]|uniref:Helix-turn-helix transcriptional regulator n=1 Tax=Streptantibioticus ferralitis TaxID=236510 RepID=A0ABT5YU03_9ACTN|nr:helix-turn-helix transcriptional regulator [Streptantibioticus ferralitis]MDF2254943.1 helix-turn-helix transcriptional regulator [Streptantibioticus ferralitis]